MSCFFKDCKNQWFPFMDDGLVLVFADLTPELASLSKIKIPRTSGTSGKYPHKYTIIHVYTYFVFCNHVHPIFK